MNSYTPFSQEYLTKTPFELESLVDRGGVLSLTLSNVSEQKLAISFDSYMAYRKRDEGDALLTLMDMKRTGDTGKYFYLVEPSDFVEWFLKEIFVVEYHQPLTHYLVATMNDIVDVIALGPPSFSYVIA
ncbi:MAG: hypothetical protein JWL63_2394 [Rhodocyclales bacterium]|nr:hypothetical protein [Rhodocyclales bacterium]